MKTVQNPAMMRIAQLPASQEAQRVSEALRIPPIQLTLEPLPILLQLLLWAKEEADRYHLDPTPMEEALDLFWFLLDDRRIEQAIVLLLGVDDPETELPREMSVLTTEYQLVEAMQKMAANMVRAAA